MRRTAIARRTDGRAVMDGSNACSVRWGTDPERLRVYDTPELAEQSRQLLCDEDDEAYLCDAEAWSRGARHFAVFSSVAPITLAALRAKCKDAFRGDSDARAELRALGRSVLASAGVDALCTLQGELREAEITAHGSATCGDGFSPAAELGDAWESIPEWVRL
jgi:hypothetical protein